MCAHKLNDGPLVCTRADAHEPGHGCTYAASEAPDRHAGTEGVQE